MKLKDVITAGNLLGGTAAVVALIEGSFTWACWAFFIAYVLDHLDGPVARLMNQSDAFGAHFDSACDFVTSSIVAGFIVYYAFAHIAGWPVWVAAALGAVPQLFGTIRQAQGQDQPLSYPCYWLGLPRPGAAIFIVALLNSSLTTLDDAFWRQLGFGYTAFIIVAISFLHLSKLPYGHNKERKYVGVMKFGRVWFFVGTPLSLVVGLLIDAPWIFFDWVVASLHVYIFGQWTQVPKADYLKIKQYVNGGPLELPLVHKDHEWRNETIAPFFEDTSAWAPKGSHSG